MRKDTLFLWAALACTLSAPFFWWPLGILGILLAVYARRPLLAIVLGIVLDVLYGVPPGILHRLAFPFTLFAILAYIVRIATERHVLRKGSRGTL